MHEHIRKFFDAVDKLGEMDVEIYRDLLTIMLLHGLPPSFQNFRCAIESRDELPTPEALQIKIVEENEARKGDSRDVGSNALLAGKYFKNPHWKKERKRKARNRSNFNVIDVENSDTRPWLAKEIEEVNTHKNLATSAENVSLYITTE